MRLPVQCFRAFERARSEVVVSSPLLSAGLEGNMFTIVAFVNFGEFAVSHFIVALRQQVFVAGVRHSFWHDDLRLQVRRLDPRHPCLH